MCPTPAIVGIDVESLSSLILGIDSFILDPRRTRSDWWRSWRLRLRSGWERFVWWLRRRRRRATRSCSMQDLFGGLRSAHYKVLIQIALQQMLIAFAALTSARPGYNASTLAGALAHGVRSRASAEDQRAPEQLIRTGFALARRSGAAADPFVLQVDSGWCWWLPLLLRGAELGLLVSQTNVRSPSMRAPPSKASSTSFGISSFGLFLGFAFGKAILVTLLIASPTSQGRQDPPRREAAPLQHPGGTTPGHGNSQLDQLTDAQTEDQIVSINNNTTEALVTARSASSPQLLGLIACCWMMPTTTPSVRSTRSAAR